MQQKYIKIKIWSANKSFVKYNFAEINDREVKKTIKITEYLDLKIFNMKTQ